MSTNNPHITNEEFIQFHKNELSEQELTLLLQHVSTCTYCAERFAESFEPFLISAPVNLKEQILIRAEKQERIQKPFQHISAKRQFFLYSTKVCAAMCGALILLFTISLHGVPNTEMKNEFTPPIQTESEWKQKKSFISSINTSMNAVASQINNHMSSIVSDTGKDKTIQ